MRGLLGGVMAEKIGYPMHGNYDLIIEHAQRRCTHPLLIDTGEDDDADLRLAA